MHKRLQQLHDQLRQRYLEPWERERILQTIHYIETEHSPKSAKRPAQKKNTSVRKK